MKTKSSTVVIGLDLGDRRHAVCVLDAQGEILVERSIANSRRKLEHLSTLHPGALVVME